jgi:hypothetical protein
MRKVDAAALSFWKNPVQTNMGIQNFEAIEVQNKPVVSKLLPSTQNLEAAPGNVTRPKRKAALSSH